MADTGRAAAVANASMSWVRMPATVSPGTWPGSWPASIVNCSSCIPRVAVAANTSVTSGGTVPRFSPTTVVPTAAADSAMAARMSSAG